MAQAQHVAASKRVGECASVEQGDGVRTVDPPDQRLELIEYLTRLGEQRYGILGRRLTLLVACAGGDAGTQLFGAARRIRAQRKTLSKFHADQYRRYGSPPRANFADLAPAL